MERFVADKLLYLTDVSLKPYLAAEWKRRIETWRLVRGNCHNPHWDVVKLDDSNDNGVRSSSKTPKRRIA